MPEPFGKRNRRVVVKPLSSKKSVKKKPALSKPNAKLYLYAAGAVLSVILAGYALAT